MSRRRRRSHQWLPVPGESQWGGAAVPDHRRGIVDPSGLKCPGRADQAQAIEAARPVEGKLADAAAQRRSACPLRSAISTRFSPTTRLSSTSSSGAVRRPRAAKSRQRRRKTGSSSAARSDRKANRMTLQCASGSGDEPGRTEAAPARARSTGTGTGTGTGEPYLLVRTGLVEEGAKGRRRAGILRQRDLAADGHDSHEEQQKAQAQQADEQARRPSLFQDPKPRSDRSTMINSIKTTIFLPTRNCIMRSSVGGVSPDRKMRGRKGSKTACVWLATVQPD